MRQDKRSYSALASNSQTPFILIIHRLSTAQVRPAGAQVPSSKLPKLPNSIITMIDSVVHLLLPGLVNLQIWLMSRHKKRAYFHTPFVEVN